MISTLLKTHVRQALPPALTCLLLTFSLAAQVPPPSYKNLKFPPLKEIKLPKIEETTLPNGLKIYLLENHELPTIRGTALIRTGNLFDPADKVGLANLTGELIRSGGTASKTGDQIDEQLENIAASVESSIDESIGRVSFSTLKERTDEVLAVFHDVLTGPAFREDKLTLAKNQMISGISRRNDDASGIAQREFTNLIYGPKTPYGWMIEYATVGNISRADIEAFYKRYFFPTNTILAIQGDFNAAEMKTKVQTLFGGWNVTQPPVPPFPAVNNTPKPGVYAAAKTDVTQTSFAMGQMGGVLNDKDYPALEVMADILGGGFQSRLFQKVRTQLGLAYEVSAAWGANFDHPGIFEIEGSTKSASTVDALKAADREVERIRTTEVTAEELESAKQTVINGFVFNFDTPSKTLNRLLTYRYYGYPEDFIFQYQKAVTAVTRADVLRVAKQYLDPAKFVIVAVGNPKDFGTPLSALGPPVSEIDLTIPEPKSSGGDPLLARAREAMGGAARLASIKDMTQVDTVQLDPAFGGLKATQTVLWLAPDKFRQENILPFGRVTSYSDGKTGWIASPQQGVQPAPPAQLQQVQFETSRIWFSLLRSENVANVTLTFDPATGLPATESYPAPGNPQSIIKETYSDWRESNGIKLPRKIVITQDGKHYGDMTITDITLNKGLTEDQIARKP